MQRLVSGFLPTRCHEICHHLLTSAGILSEKE
jgi:hypothetical protein